MVVYTRVGRDIIYEMIRQYLQCLHGGPQAVDLALVVGQGPGVTGPA